MNKLKRIWHEGLFKRNSKSSAHLCDYEYLQKPLDGSSKLHMVPTAAYTGQEEAAAGLTEPTEHVFKCDEQ